MQAGAVPQWPAGLFFIAPIERRFNTTVIELISFTSVQTICVADVEILERGDPLKWPARTCVRDFDLWEAGRVISICRNPMTNFQVSALLHPRQKHYPRTRQVCSPYYVAHIR